MNINGNNGGQQHWQLEVDAQGVAWATLNKAGESTNSLSSLVMDELSQLLDQLDRSPPKGLIFRSGKAAGFIAGADIQEFTQARYAAKGIELVERGWQLFNRLAGGFVSDAGAGAWSLPWWRSRAGAGLSLPAGRRRAGTRMGLPEVMLGIVPGWGGMLRLPERVGRRRHWT
jgi:3-hydroxyacyl-CoA dehydrogenase/enoyl-CoA hydratase/3-hydroxybutyryl-CoA epimerase